VQVVTELSRAFALCAASDAATEIRDDVSFFQALQAALNKQSSNNRKTPEQIDAAIRQLVSKAITTEGQVIDVFTAAGLPKPDISILSDQFLAEVRGLKHKNVAAELLEKLLKDELKVRSRRNLVQSQVFSEKLKKTLNAYHNRAISTMQVIEELIKLAKELDAATRRGQDLGLTDDEVAFYDAWRPMNPRCMAMGDDKLQGDRRRAHHAGAQERDHRLDAARKRAGKNPRDGEAHPEQVRLPAGFAGRGREDRAGAGRTAVGRLG
jgi:type I restriction enzyme R subunit